MNVKFLATLLVLADPLQAANLLRGGELDQAKESPAFEAESKSNNWSIARAVKEVLKKPMKRRTFVMDSSRNEVFSSMGDLKSNKAFTIKIYRGDAHSNQSPLEFMSQPKDAPLEEGEKLRLIQTTPKSDPNKKLCIMAATKETKINYDALQKFTREITAAKSENEKEDIFKMYKNQIGLPGLGSDFSFKIYAWETDYDCALYNVGVPKALYSDFSVMQLKALKAKTEIFSESHSEGRNFAVQLSRPHLNYNPLTLLQVKSNAQGPSNLKLQPIAFNYTNMSGLFDEISPDDTYFIKAYKIGDKCAAIVSQNLGGHSENVQKFAEIIDECEGKGLDCIRNQAFKDEQSFDTFFESFTESHTVSFVIWNKGGDGSCDYPVDSISRRNTRHTDSDDDTDSDDETDQDDD
jgi:hypothetical protein